MKQNGTLLILPRLFYVVPVMVFDSTACIYYSLSCIFFNKHGDNSSGDAISPWKEAYGPVFWKGVTHCNK